MPAAALESPDLDVTEATDRDLQLLADHARTPELRAEAKAEQLSRACPKDYAATPVRVVRGPGVQLRHPAGVGTALDILSTADARAFANAILAAADVADRNG